MTCARRSPRTTSAASRTRSRTHAEAGLDDTAIELQLLYGMAEPVHTALPRLGLRVRVYAPVGELVPGMGYLVRRLLENTSNESFVRHQLRRGARARRARRRARRRRGGDPGDPTRVAETRPATDPDTPGPFANEPPGRAASRAVARAPGRRGPGGARGARLRRPRAGRRSTPSPRRGELVSVDPARPARVVCRSGAATDGRRRRRDRRRRQAWPEWRETPWPAARPPCCSEPRPCCGAAATSSRPSRCSRPASRSPRPTPTSARPSTSASTTGARRCGWTPARTVEQAPGERNAYRYEPRGVGLVISPWNFPLAIPTGMVAGALVTGNAVLFKPAEQTPGVALPTRRGAVRSRRPPRRARLPARASGEEVGAACSSSTPTWRSSRSPARRRSASRSSSGPPCTGRASARSSASSPRWAARTRSSSTPTPTSTSRCPPSCTSAFGYAGQKCSAASRLIAVAPVFDELVERLVGAAADLAGRAPVRARHGRAVRSSTPTRKRRVRALPGARARRRRRRARARRRPDDGWFVGPTMVVLDDPRRPAWRPRRSSGRCSPCCGADDCDHALALANDTDYALTGGVFSRSPSRIAHAAQASCAPATSTSTAASPARSSAASPSAATGCRASARRPAAPTTCCSSSTPAR